MGTFRAGVPAEEPPVNQTSVEYLVSQESMIRAWLGAPVKGQIQQRKTWHRSYFD